MRKVLVIKGTSKYGVLSEAALQIAEGFAKRGYQVDLLDLENRVFGGAMLLEKMQGGYAFCFSCQAIGFETMLASDCPMASAFPIPYIGWIFDDVIYHKARVAQACYENTYLLTVDLECARAIQKMFPGDKHIECLHHGGFPVTPPGDAEAAEAFWAKQEKDIDLLFAGSLGTPPDLDGFLKQVPPLLAYLTKEAAGYLSEQPGLAVRSALEMVLSKVGEVLTGELLLELDCVVVMLDDWVRWNSRHAVLTALLEGGISVTLVGDGAVYAQLAQRYPDQLHFLGSADISQVVSFMARSKVVMNPCMAYAEGLHERLFTAMLCKAVPFTPRTPYLEEKFGSCFWYIDLKDLGSMVRQVRHILEAPQEAALQVEQNYRWAMEQHTWEHRGEEIIDYYEQWIAPEKGQGELP